MFNTLVPVFIYIDLLISYALKLNDDDDDDDDDDVISVARSIHTNNTTFYQFL